MKRAVRVVLCGVLAAAGWALAGCDAPARVSAGRPLAVVMAGIPRSVTLVDLSTGEKVTEYRLRSMASEVAVDPDARLVMTAQCGGVGADADDAIGVYDVTRGGSVEYLELETPNPGEVYHVAPGRALVSNGWMDDEGVVVGLVDPRSGTNIMQGRVPDMVSASFAGGAMWAWCNETDSDSPVLRRVDPVSLESSVVTTGPDVPVTVLGSPASRGPMFAITRIGQEMKGSRVRIRRFDGTAESLEVPGRTMEFDDGPASGAAVIGDVLAIPDYSNVDPEDHGDTVWLVPVDLDSDPIPVEVPGGPASITVWDSRFIVVEQYTGRILSIDPKTAAVDVIADIDGHEGWYDRIAVLP